MKRADLQARMREEIIRQMALEHQMEGARKMYDAALLMSDQAGAQMHRDNLHTLLDCKLDSAASVQLLVRQLAESTE